MKTKTISIKEFVQLGYLQELNRQFLHPRGLALSVDWDMINNVYALRDIWDYRGDPEGIFFGNDELNQHKADTVAKEFNKHVEFRKKLLKNKSPIQPVSHQWSDADIQFWSEKVKAIMEKTAETPTTRTPGEKTSISPKQNTRAHKDRGKPEGQEDWFTSGELAEHIGVRKDTIKEWVKSGKTVPGMITKAGWKLWSPEQAETLQMEYNRSKEPDTI